MPDNQTEPVVLLYSMPAILRGPKALAATLVHEAVHGRVLFKIDGTKRTDPELQTLYQEFNDAFAQTSGLYPTEYSAKSPDELIAEIATFLWLMPQNVQQQFIKVYHLSDGKPSVVDILKKYEIMPKTP